MLAADGPTHPPLKEKGVPLLFTLELDLERQGG